MLRKLNEIISKKSYVLFCLGFFTSVLFSGFVFHSSIWFFIGAIGFAIFWFQYVPHIGVKK